MLKNKESYQDIQNRSNAVSWRYSFAAIIKEISTTINTIKERLKNNKQFDEQDLPTLRQLYSQVTKLVDKNRKENNNDTSKEMALIQQMLNIINGYGEQTNIFAGIQKRVIKTMGGSSVASVANYYYHVGRDISYQLLKIA